jgi:hypothetical protein
VFPVRYGLDLYTRILFRRNSVFKVLNTTPRFWARITPQWRQKVASSGRKRIRNLAEVYRGVSYVTGRGLEYNCGRVVSQSAERGRTTSEHHHPLCFYFHFPMDRDGLWSNSASCLEPCVQLYLSIVAFAQNRPRLSRPTIFAFFLLFDRLRPGVGSSTFLRNVRNFLS